MITYLSIAQAEIVSAEAAQLQQRLAVEGMALEVLGTDMFEGFGGAKILSQAQALTQLYQQEPHLADLVAKTEGLKITHTLGRLSDPTLAQAQASGMLVDTTFITPHLVWIITISGVSPMAFNPPNGVHRQAPWINFVLDAVTGRYLMGFI